MRGASKIFLCIFSVALSLAATGCSLSPDRYHPGYAAHRATIQRLLILPPEIDLIVDTPEGKPMWRDGLSRQAGDQTRRAMVQLLSDRKFTVRLADENLLQAKETTRLRALYRSVNRAIQLHAYGPQLFPAKTKRFDYALGAVSQLLSAGGADALMLIRGRQTVSGQRVRTWISMAVVEPAGNIIWYGVQGRHVPASAPVHQEVLDLAERVVQPFLREPS